jgi:transposase
MSEHPPSPRRRGRPTPPIVLSDDERQTLARWARRPTSSQALALRCRIVLACAEGLSNVEAGRRLDVHEKTVGKWRARFLQRRLEGLVDEPRPGVPRTITDEQVEQVIVKTLEETPPDATHWSTRAMARATGMSQTAIVRIWRAFGLKPHLDQAWKLSTDPQFIDKVRDVVGLYLNPPEAAVVLCVDEKSSIQALDRTAPILPLLPTTPRRQSHDYTRHGTTNLYAALNVASGNVITEMTAPPRGGVQALPGPDRPGRAGRVGRACDRGQLLNPLHRGDPPLAGAPSPVPAALHPDLQLLAEPGRALVRRADQQVAPARQPLLSRGTDQLHPVLDRHLE